MKQLLLLFLLFPPVVFAQKQGRARIDSLLMELPGSKDDTNKVKLLNDLSDNYSRYSTDSGVAFGEKAILLADHLHWLPGNAYANYFLGFNYYNKSNYPLALNYLFKALESFEKIADQKGIANTTRKIGNVYRDQKNYQKALDCYFNALQIFEKCNDKMGIGRCYSNIGEIYDYEEKYTEAIDFFIRAIKIDEEIDYKNGLVITCQRLGKSYTNNKNYALGLKYSLQALDIALKNYDKNVIAKEQIHESYGNVGISYLKIAGNNIKEKRSGKNDMALQRSVYYLDTAIRLAKDMGELTDLQLYYYNLSEAEALSGDHIAALNSYRQYSILKDSVFSRTNNDAITNLEHQREIDLKENQIKFLAQEGKVKDLKSQKEILTRRILIGGIIMVVVVCLFIIMYFIRKQKSEKLLANEKINTFLKEQELRSVNEMMEVQERERKRIASDLHDRLGSILSTVKLYFSSVEEHIYELKEQNKDQYNKAGTLLDEACDEVRKISHDLVSGELVSFGLVSALNQLAKTIEDTGQVKMKILVFDMDRRLESSVEIALYRIVQELINNILKHAQANEVIVQLNKTGNNLNIMVEDNGIGFDAAIARAKGGLGLRNIESRVSKLNGKVHFDSGRGSGTTIIIDIPV